MNPSSFFSKDFHILAAISETTAEICCDSGFLEDAMEKIENCFPSDVSDEEKEKILEEAYVHKFKIFKENQYSQKATLEDFWIISMEDNLKSYFLNELERQKDNLPLENDHSQRDWNAMCFKIANLPDQYFHEGFSMRMPCGDLLIKLEKTSCANMLKSLGIELSFGTKERELMYM